MAGKTGESDPRHLAADLKAAKALELRLKSWRWSAIADELGYANASGPFKAVQQLMKDLPAEDAAEFRRIEGERLEEIRKKLEPHLPQGQIIDKYLAVTDRLHRIMGVAQKHEHTGPNGQPIQVVTGVPVPAVDPGVKPADPPPPPSERNADTGC